MRRLISGYLPKIFLVSSLVVLGVFLYRNDAVKLSAPEMPIEVKAESTPVEKEKPDLAQFDPLLLKSLFETHEPTNSKDDREGVRVSIQDGGILSPATIPRARLIVVKKSTLLFEEEETEYGTMESSILEKDSEFFFSSPATIVVFTL